MAIRCVACWMKNSINMYRVESIIEGGRKTALILLLGSVISCSVELNEDVGNQKAETLTESEKVTLAVKFDSGVSESGIRANLEKTGAESFDRIFPDTPGYRSSFSRMGLDRWYRVEFSKDVTVTRALDVMSSIPGALIVEEPRQVASCSFNDPFLNTQWGLINRSNSGVDINVEPVWEKYTTGSKDVIVAVLDGGVDITHIDLAANCIKAQADGGSYNFVNKSTALTYDNHGTHVAGVIAAVSNNGKGISGIAGGNAVTGQPGVRILSCQILGRRSGEANADLPSIASAMVYGATHGAVISQNSWGYTYDVNGDGEIDENEYQNAMEARIDGVLKDAVDYFIRYAGCDDNGDQRPDSPMKGGVVIFAAGNDSLPNSAPANYAPIIAVGSIASDGSRSTFSNYGDWVDICAPGTNISSTISGSQYGSMNGTSMACPHVSGAAALLVSYYGGRGFTNEMLEERLLKGANKNIVPEGAQIGPLLDVYGAFQYAMTECKPPVISTEYAGDFSFRQSENVSIPFSVTDPQGLSVNVTLETDGPGTLAQSGSGYAFKLYCPLATPGTYNARIKAENINKVSSVYEFTYTIRQNHAPTAVKPIQNLIVDEGGINRFSLADYFEDEDGDKLSFSAESSDASVVSVSVNDGILALSASGLGSVEISVTAMDAVDAKIEMRFKVMSIKAGTVVDVYPNPVKDYLFIRPACDKTAVEVTIMSSHSSERFSLTCGAFEPASLDLRNIAPGRYSVKVLVDGREVKRNIVKL